MSKPEPISLGSSLEPRPGEAITAEVHVYSKTELLAKYVIEHGEYIIGRDATCHLMVEADAVSRHHARLSFSAFELIIEDLGSSNGVFIEGVQVQIPTRIRPDQELQIGSARLFVRLSARAAAQLNAALADKDLGLHPVREMLTATKYKVVTTIGRGGMGIVMQARDLRIRRTVAMKVMKTDSRFSRENVLRFVDEAQLTGQLEHPNIVPVYELGTDESGETFYTMKYVKGITLDEILRGLRAGRASVIERYPLGVLLTIFQKICDAVAFAHAKGVVHRDLKPENLMIGAYGEVLVMDWGLAKNMTGAQREGAKIETMFATEPAPDPRGFQTMHGLIVGTPPYISPEQARGDLEQIDGRSDIFVLGEILYAILTLRPPVAGNDVLAIVEAILGSKITPPVSYNTPVKSSRRLSAAHEPHVPSEEEVLELLHLPGKRVPEGLSAVVMKAMKLAREERYQTVEEMQADIAAYQGGFATKAERAGLGKQIFLWAGRHRREVALFVIGFLLVNTLVAGFIYQLTVEKNRALASEAQAKANEERAKRGESLAAERLNELRGTAPTFFDEAGSMLDEQSFVQALDKIDYALEQVPNEPTYHLLRGKVLQSLLRWEEAAVAFEQSLSHNPKLAEAKLNLDLTRKLQAAALEAGGETPAILALYHQALIDQRRVGEALAILPQIPKERDSFRRTLRAAFEKRGFKDRFETTDDEKVKVNLSRMAMPDLRKLADLPVIELILDDSKIPDLSGLRDFKLEGLSINRTDIIDLRPLIGMPLKRLSMEMSRVGNLGPLAKLPLETLRVSQSRVVDLSPLAGQKIEELALANCKNVRDLSPLKGVPLQRLDLSKTGVTDLSALIGSPLRELNLEGCVDLIDLRPLLEMKELEGVIIPSQCKDIEYLREHVSLRRLSYKKATQPVYEFWQQFDERKETNRPAAAR